MKTLAPPMMNWDERTAKSSTVVKRQRRPKSRDEGAASQVIQREHYVASKINCIMLSILKSHKSEDDVQ